jgi:hypothetical protein
MRSLSFAVAAAPLGLVVLAGCMPQRVDSAGLPPPAHSNPIIVREFAVSPGVVTLDPSFGFSLYRGAPGVPPPQRAAAVGRAAAFSLADAVSQQLSRLGYDVVDAETAGSPEPGSGGGARALVVSGDFRRIYEGHRHENASIAVDVAVDYRAPGAAAPQRLASFEIDSRRLLHQGLVAAAGRQGEDVNYEATRLGAAIGRYVGELARADRWPAAAAR